MALSRRVVDIGDWRESIRPDVIPARKTDATMAHLSSALSERMQISTDVEPMLGGAVRYLLNHSGSMIRPQIVYRLAGAYGIHDEAATDLAIALEYFHTASLVFDDLPCMDDASMRRGAPCVHIVFDESTAILAALALINRAYALVWRATASCPPEFRAPSLAYLERHLGTHGLLNGQSLDLNYSKLPRTLHSTERVAKGKTVSLISLTLVQPAIAGGATSRELQLLDRISSFWGLSYQIVDDLKDVLESPSTSGKTTARDKSLERPNMALAIGVGASVDRLQRLICAGDRSLEMLIRVRPSLEFLRSFRGTLEDELSRIIDGAGAHSINRQS